MQLDDVLKNEYLENLMNEQTIQTILADFVYRKWHIQHPDGSYSVPTDEQAQKRHAFFKYLT